jgi:3-oxoacyl-[acyl-carrier-protein] synthase II
MIGHCLGAAGGLEAIATIKSITTGWVHPTINQFVSSHYPMYSVSISNIQCQDVGQVELSFSKFPIFSLSHILSVHHVSAINLLQNPEPEVNFDTVANEKKQHKVNVGEFIHP